MTAKRHHYVPQCYLKGFVRDREKPRLYVVDGKERRAFSTAPANVAAEHHFHTIDREGLPPDALENAFSSFEGELAPALERIIAARSLRQEDDRALLLNLMALMAVKNPRHRENFRSFHEQVVKRIMGLARASPERWASQMRRAKTDGYIKEDADTDYQKMREFFESDQYTIQTTTDYHLDLELKSLDTLLPFFFKRRWWLLRAPPDQTGFITSDHPVCLMWSHPARRHRFPPPGHGLRQTQIVFSISNELALMGAFDADEGETDADESLIADINGSILVDAERQVYARDKDFTYRLVHHNGRIMRGSELLGDEQCITGRRRGTAR